jgi:hypothetical protein
MRLDAEVAGEVVGGREPGIAAADDGEIGVDVGGNGIGAMHLLARRRCPIGFDVRGAGPAQVGRLDAHGFPRQATRDMPERNPPRQPENRRPALRRKLAAR